MNLKSKLKVIGKLYPAYENSFVYFVTYAMFNSDLKLMNALKDIVIEHKKELSIDEFSLFITAYNSLKEIQKENKV